MPQVENHLSFFVPDTSLMTSLDAPKYLSKEGAVIATFAMMAYFTRRPTKMEISNTAGLVLVSLAKKINGCKMIGMAAMGPIARKP
mmetsp:Transcript_47222/g.106013  ORF Transcript_47222/g.106013 Transcript_47222/m.106013 type:complete len:86 (+) Transcript_47222:49-306(+)